MEDGTRPERSLETYGGKKFRHFRFTCFDMCDFRTDFLRQVAGDAIYLVYGFEVCPDTGRLHRQGFVSFGNPRSWRSVVDLLCCDTRVADYPNAAVKYCKKDGNIVEYGQWVPQNQGKRNDLNEIKELVKEGAGRKEIFLAASSYQAYRMGEIGLKLFERKRNWVPEVFWYWGASETGKSRQAFAEAGEDCWESGKNLEWWDGYDGHENVVIEEFRGDFCKFHELLRILDRHPYRVMTKGGSAQLLAKKIWITSPYHPKDLYKTIEDKHQLMRRITLIKFFGNGKDGGTEVGSNNTIPTVAASGSPVPFNPDLVYPQ